jgi:23S rRNA (adenine2503-C2)-methyltransferase
VGAKVVTDDPRIVLKDLLPEEMGAVLSSWGLKHFRARQLSQWLYRRYALSFEEMSNISKVDRAFLHEHARIGSLEILARQQAADGTQKWLLGLEDGLRVETVIIPEEDHWTQCISTQVGCAMKCTFCRTARLGLRRQLSTWEIVDQVVVARRSFEEGHIRNVVLMGMGEPLSNYDAVVRALRLLRLPEGLNLSKRRITLSTCGLIPQMRLLAREGLQIKLAISLNAATDSLRSRLMPVNRTYPLKELLATCREIPLPLRDRITFEYILFRGINDSQKDALRLARLLRGMRCKVNLIPHNPFPGSPYEPSSREAIVAFQGTLKDAHISAPIRWSRGSDISAACGQLAGGEDAT